MSWVNGICRLVFVVACASLFIACVEAKLVDPQGSVLSSSMSNGYNPAPAPASIPSSGLHYASGAGSSGSSVGFNLVDVSSAAELSYLPAGAKGLIYLGMCNGADAAFVNAVDAASGNPSLYGFYLMDEPDPTGQWFAACPIANLQAEADYIHLHSPGAIVFITANNMGTTSNPNFNNYYNAANSHIDLFGIDPYPCRTDAGGCDYSVIGKSVAAAVASGIPLSAIVPVYQTFGGGNYITDGGGKYILPTAAEEQQIVQAWKQAVPKTAFDFAYAWASQNGDTALSGSPELQSFFHSYFLSSPTP